MAGTARAPAVPARRPPVAPFTSGVDRKAVGVGLSGGQRQRVAPAGAAGTPVPSDRFVLLGDTPGHSADSRRKGFFAAARIQGVVVRRLGKDAGNN